MLKFVLFLLIATTVLSLTCPSGHYKAKRPGSVPIVNGCGPKTLKISGAINSVIETLKPSFVSCCNEHDRCYSDCTKSQKTCDSEFKECLLSKCSSLALHCKLAGNAMYEAVNLFGKPAYEDAQKRGCYCVKPTPEEVAEIKNKIQDVFKNIKSIFNIGMEEEEGMVEDDVEGSEDDVEAYDDVDALMYDVEDYPSFLEVVSE